MRIGSVPSLPPALGGIREKGSGEEGGSALGYGGGRRRDKENGGETPRTEGSPDDSEIEIGEEAAKLSEAVKKFEADKQALSSGLKAELDGTGPGLRVVLKDKEGRTLRQCSGREFMALANASDPVLKAPGKLLDRKV